MVPTVGGERGLRECLYDFTATDTVATRMISAVRMGSDVSHFTVPLNVLGIVTSHCP